MTNNCVIRLRKSLKNPLLDRTQYEILAIHEGQAAPKKSELQ